MTIDPVRDADLAVCVALNDNDRAWYEMLVPFLLSLRRTDYRGHVVVIGFGLSQRKVEILRGQSVTVVETGETPLAVARYSVVAKLCDWNPALKKVALYDADIWFCRREFDLFSEIEGDNLHACRDTLYCTFIEGALIGPRREEHRALVGERVVALCGGALQAGLLAGSAQAWRDFGAHVQDCVGRVGVDFSQDYGLDTTILHLWAAQSRVTVLPETQNFVIKGGVGETRDAQNTPVLRCASGEIRGLHMTSDVRFLNSWRFYSHHRDYALTAGRPFALSRTMPTPLPEVPADLQEAFGAMGLEIVAIRAEENATLCHIRDRDGLHVVATGCHEIDLRARAEPMRFVLTVMSLSGLPGPIRSTVRLRDQVIEINREASQWIAMSVPHGDAATLSAEGLPGQMGKVVWTVSEAVHLWQ